MTIDWTIDPTSGLVHLIYDGDPDFEIWAAEMLRIFAHTDFQPGFGFVAEIDGGGVPDAEHMNRVLQFVEAHDADFANARWANVTRNLAHYGMTRVAQARSDHLSSEVRAFRDVAAAAEWAARPPRATEPQ